MGLTRHEGRSSFISAIIIFFVGLTFFQSVSSYSASLYKKQGSSNKSWDVLIFTQNWPRSVCNKWLEGNGHQCLPFPSGTWTIHGIWPTKFGTLGPGFCDNSKPFNPKDIRSIESQLDRYWTPVQQHGEKTQFWSHEWTKHGTCAAQLPAFSSPLQYFSKGLEWMQSSYNMQTVLTKAGIYPGRKYYVQDILGGVKDVLGKNPQVICYLDRQHNSVLLEVRICFDKRLSLVDCDGTVVGGGSNGGLTNCRTNQMVNYPQ